MAFSLVIAPRAILAVLEDHKIDSCSLLLNQSPPSKESYSLI